MIDQHLCAWSLSRNQGDGACTDNLMVIPRGSGTGQQLLEIADGLKLELKLGTITCTHMRIFILASLCHT